MKKLKKQLKKGFTLVELVVVIAVIAILAAVSVVSYFSVTESAKKSNDITLTTQMNQILQLNEATHKASSMSDVIDQLEEGGFSLEKLTPTSDNSTFVWDKELNKIFLLDSNKEILSPENINMSPVENCYALVGSKEEADHFLGYSLYIKPNYKDQDIKGTSNIESGLSKSVNITYEDSAKESVNIITNGGTLTLNNPNATVYHFGTSKNVDIKAVDPNNSYHLEGSVDQEIKVTTGHVVLNETSKIGKLVLAPEANDVSVQLESFKENLIIEGNKEQTVKIEKSGSTTSKVFTETKVESTSQVETEEIKQINTVEEFKAGLKVGGYLKLMQDIVLPSVSANDAVLTVEGKTYILDLNGKHLSASLRTGYSDRHNYGIGNYGDLTIMDSSAEGNGRVSSRGIENFNKLKVLNGTIEALDKIGGAAIWNVADLEIYGGTFIVENENQIGTSSDPAGVGALNNSGTAYIKAGVFKDVNKRTYAIISTGDIVIDPIKDEDVIVEGTHGGLSIDSGTASVYGGIYSSTEFYALYVSNDGMGNNPQQAAVNIYGGDYTGKTYSVWVGSDVNEVVNSSVAISNGTFHNKLKVQDNNAIGDKAIRITGGTFFGESPVKYVDGNVYKIIEKDGSFIVDKK